MDETTNNDITCVYTDDLIHWNNIENVHTYSNIEELSEILLDNEYTTIVVIPPGFVPTDVEFGKIFHTYINMNNKIGLVFSDFRYNNVPIYCSANYHQGLGFVPFIIKSGHGIKFDGNVGNLIDKVKQFAIVYHIPQILFEHNVKH